MTQPEPLTLRSTDRYCILPIVHQDIFDLYELQASKFWTVKEVHFGEDYKNWQQLSSDEQKFISVTLAFFANADNLVIENLHSRLRTEIQFPEAQAFFCIQGSIEQIHALCYAESIQTVIRDPVKRLELFRAIDNNPIVQPKLQWTKKWIESTDSLGKRLVAMTFVEGVFFSSSFASLFWARKRRNLPGICFSNEKIVEDEALHVRHGALLYRKYIVNKMPLEELYDMAREAVAIEHEFVESALPVKLIDMNSTEMKQYVCFVTDLVLELLGVPKLFNCENPFEWMIGIGLLGKSNFFEKRVAEYVLAGQESEIRQVEFLSLGDTLDFWVKKKVFANARTNVAAHFLNKTRVDAYFDRFGDCNSGVGVQDEDMEKDTF